jgi:hypothetical protein
MKKINCNYKNQKKIDKRIVSISVLNLTFAIYFLHMTQNFFFEGIIFAVQNQSVIQ